MNERIGTLAGRVWEYLADKGETNMASIPRAVKEKTGLVNLALGWLAREDKLTFRESGGKILVSVKK